MGSSDYTKFLIPISIKFLENPLKAEAKMEEIFQLFVSYKVQMTIYGKALHPVTGNYKMISKIPFQPDTQGIKISTVMTV